MMVFISNGKLQSQFPPNPTPNWPKRSTPSYLSIHSGNRHPTKLTLTNARKWWWWDLNIATRFMHIIYNSYSKKVVKTWLWPL